MDSGEVRASLHPSRPTGSVSTEKGLGRDLVGLILQCVRHGEVARPVVGMDRARVPAADLLALGRDGAPQLEPDENVVPFPRSDKTLGSDG